MKIATFFDLLIIIANISPIVMKKRIFFRFSDFKSNRSICRHICNMLCKGIVRCYHMKPDGWTHVSDTDCMELYFKYEEENKERWGVQQ